jgi:hypothetical protein
MKSFVAANGRWFLAGLVLVAVGLLVVTGLGQRRGTRWYRWRVGLWVLALSLMGAGGVAGCKGSVPGTEEPGGAAPKVAGEKLNPGAKANAPEGLTGKADDGEEESLVMCYQQVMVEPEGTARNPVDVEAESPPVMMCYETVPIGPEGEVEPEGTARNPVDVEAAPPPVMMCYETVPIGPEGEVEPEGSGDVRQGEEAGNGSAGGAKRDALLRAFVKGEAAPATPPNPEAVPVLTPPNPEAVPGAVPTGADAESIDIREAPPANEEKPPPAKMCYRTIHLEIEG